MKWSQYIPGFLRKFDSDIALKGDIKDKNPPTPPPPPILPTILLVLLWSFILFGFTLFAYNLGTVNQERAGERDFFGLTAPSLREDNSIDVRDDVFDAWTREVKSRHFTDRKIGSVFISNSLIGAPSDHIFMGIYERDKLRRPTEAALHFYLALSNGHPDAERLYRGLSVPTGDYEELYQRFVTLHQMNGQYGLERLGQYYLGNDAFNIARKMSTKLRFTEPNDFVWPDQQEAETLAYIQFHMAALCGLSSAYEWRAETARYYRFTEERENAMKQRANAELAELARRYKTGRTASRDKYCEAEHLTGQIERLRDDYLNQVAVLEEEELENWDRQSHPCDNPYHDFTDEQCSEFDAILAQGAPSGQPAASIPTFEDLIDAIQNREGSRSRRRAGSRRRGAGNLSASPVYRDNPGGGATSRIDPVTGDAICTELGENGECAEPVERADVLSCYDQSKREFNLGEADMAVGRTVNARRRFEKAIAIGRTCQSEYAELAGKRMAALNLTCEYTPQSLARISRGYRDQPNGGPIVSLRARQRALRAKGHYQGAPDGIYGGGTRDAVRKFQREFGFSETGDLSPIETVYLICSAAEAHSDLGSTRTLGIMYLAGLGVVQNTDRGIRELKKAADRGYGDAMFDLAIIYGSGVVVSSYRLCGLVESIDLADSWLVQAARVNQRQALDYVNRFGSDEPAERWRKILDELEVPLYKNRLEQLGNKAACSPNQ